MRKSLNYLFVVIFVSTFVACKNEPVKKVLTNDYAMLNQEERKPQEIATMRSSAIAIIEKRQKESQMKAITIIEKDLWQYEATVKNSDFMKEDSLGGRWIDFGEDLNYVYGSYDQEKGRGKYHFDFDNGILLLVDDSELIKPQEFKVKSLNDMMIFEGSFVYKDENLQAKLVRKPKRPTASK